MLGSGGLTGLQMGLGIRVKWALEGKQTRRSAEGGPLLSLPLMVLSLSLSLSSCGVFLFSDLVHAVAELYACDLGWF